MPKVTSKKRDSIDKKAITTVPNGRLSTDVVITMQEEDIEAIITGEKNHIFRMQPWSKDVYQAWIYVKDPVKSVCFLADVSDEALPGTLDARGRYNSTYNHAPLLIKGKRMRAAYRIDKLYKLKFGIPYGQMKENNWAIPAGLSNTYLSEGMKDELEKIPKEQI
jgi:hypothetical protein